jgi:hypothetical protein
VKSRTRTAQGYRETDHIFSTNFHVRLRARSAEGVTFQHYLVLNVEARRKDPCIIGHWFSEDQVLSEVGHSHHTQPGAGAVMASSHTTPSDSVLILSWNVWNFNSPWAYRVKQLASHILKSAPVIIGFQEMRYDAQNSPSELGAPFQVRHLADLLPKYQYVYQPGLSTRSVMRKGKC